jgi:hypothetical protein
MSLDREELADELAGLSARHAHHEDPDIRAVAVALHELAALLWDNDGDASASKLLKKIRAEAAAA